MNLPVIQLTEVTSLDQLPAVDVIMPKLDGFYGIWSPLEQTYYSKRSNVFFNPPTHNVWLPNDYAKCHLLGELLHSGGFQATSRTVRKQTRQNSWSGVYFHIYDIQGDPVSGCDFHTRRLALTELFKNERFIKENPFVTQIKYAAFSSQYSKQLFDLCIQRNYEGLVFRSNKSKWSDKEHGYKWKVISDMEGTIVGHNPGTGRLRGLLGSYQINTDCGHNLSVGSGLTDIDRANVLPLGTKITFHYRGKSENGCPLKPTLKGEYVI